MQNVYLAFPMSSVILARTIVTDPTLDVQLSIGNSSSLLGRWGPISAWLIAAAAVGVAGLDVYALNDQPTATAFLALCWLLGNGYVIASAVRSPILTLVYCAALLGVSCYLYRQLQAFGKMRGRNAVVVMLVWASFLLVLACTGGAREGPVPAINIAPKILNVS